MVLYDVPVQAQSMSSSEDFWSNFYLNLASLAISCEKGDTKQFNYTCMINWPDFWKLSPSLIQLLSNGDKHESWLKRLRAEKTQVMFSNEVVTILCLDSWYSKDQSIRKFRRHSKEVKDIIGQDENGGRGHHGKRLFLEMTRWAVGPPLLTPMAPSIPPCLPRCLLALLS